MNATVNIRTEKRLSEKSGKYYTVALIELVPGYEKQVFMDNAEVMLINNYYGNPDKKENK